MVLSEHARSNIFLNFLNCRYILNFKWIYLEAQMELKIFLDLLSDSKFYELSIAHVFRAIRACYTVETELAFIFLTICPKIL